MPNHEPETQSPPALLHEEYAVTPVGRIVLLLSGHRYQHLPIMEEGPSPHDIIVAITSIGEELAKLTTERDALKAALAKLPKTADGADIFPGMPVWTRYTRDAGKTWKVRGPASVWSVSAAWGGNITLNWDKGVDHMTYTTIGDNRIYATEAAANEACETRNAKSHSFEI